MHRLLLFNFFVQVLTQNDIRFSNTKNLAFLPYIVQRHTFAPMRETEDMHNKIAIIQKLFQNKSKSILKTKNQKFILLSIRYSPLKNEASKKITHFFIGFSNHQLFHCFRKKLKIYKKIDTKEPRERPIRSKDSQELFPERL